MKRVFLLMTTILLMAAASGCMQTPQEEAPPEQEPEQSQPLHLTSLSIELQRDGQNAQQLLDAVKILPQELQTALASYDVTVDEITMTVGSSHTATVQAWNPAALPWPCCPPRHWRNNPPPLPPSRCPALCSGIRAKTSPPGTSPRKKPPWSRVIGR